jgi:hypothetical protein
MKLNGFKQIYLLVLILLMTIFFSACAGRPALENYPTREIDRPYTVPEGLTKWYVNASLTNRKDEKSAAETFSFINFFTWQTAITDSWSLLWLPLPFGVSHQFWNTENSRFGFTAVMRYIGFGSISGWHLGPYLSGSYRYKFTSDFAIDLGGYFSPEISLNADQTYRWDSNIYFGPLFQVNDSTTLRPSIIYSVALEQAYISTPFTDADEINKRIGAELSATFALGKQWTFMPSYSYFSNKSKGWESHTVDFDFTHIW